MVVVPPLPLSLHRPHRREIGLAICASSSPLARYTRVDRADPVEVAMARY